MIIWLLVFLWLRGLNYNIVSLSKYTSSEHGISIFKSMSESPFRARALSLSERAKTDETHVGNHE